MDIEMKYLKRATAQLRRAGIEDIVIRRCLWGYVPHNPTLRGTITATVKRTAAECVESVINGSNLPLQVTPAPAAYNANDLRPPPTAESPLYQYVRSVSCDVGLHDYCNGCTCDHHTAEQTAAKRGRKGA